MNSKIDISVVIPVYNAELCIEDLTNQIVNALKPLGLLFEILLIDDYSNDESWSKIKTLKEKHGTVLKGIKLAKNFGQHNATFCGIKNAVGNYIITIDDDFQHNPKDILLLLQEIQKTNKEVIYGLFKKRKHNFIRALFRYLIKNIGFIRVFNDDFRELSSYRIINQRIKNKISETQSCELNIDELIKWHTESIASIYVDHSQSRKLKSGYNLSKIFFFATNTVVITSDFTLRALSGIGFIITFISVVIGTYFFYRKLVHHISVPGYTSIIVTVLFTTGFITYTLSFIALYLSNVFKNQVKKPTFSVLDEI